MLSETTRELVAGRVRRVEFRRDGSIEAAEFWHERDEESEPTSGYDPTEFPPEEASSVRRSDTIPILSGESRGFPEGEAKSDTIARELGLLGVASGIQVICSGMGGE